MFDYVDDILDEVVLKTFGDIRQGLYKEINDPSNKEKIFQFAADLVKSNIMQNEQFTSKFKADGVKIVPMEYTTGPLAIKVTLRYSPYLNNGPIIKEYSTTSEFEFIF